MQTIKIVLALLISAFVVPGVIAQTPQPDSPPAKDAYANWPPPPPDGQTGTRAPDGIGVVVAPSPAGAGRMTTGPWVPFEADSLQTPIKAGATIPPGSIVQTVDGQPFDLNAAVAAKPTVLIFYRGGWCPYCNAHLRELQGSEPALRALGYQILAVSSDPPQALRQTLTDDHLSYVLLSDAPLTVAAKFGLRFKVNAAYVKHLREVKSVDLVQQSGGYLLTPAAFILDRSGVIRFAYVNTNFTVRVGQDALLAAARTAVSQPAAGVAGH